MWNIRESFESKIPITNEIRYNDVLIETFGSVWK